MATKVIYFTIYGHDEQAEFRANDSEEDVRDIFRSAAEAGPHDILKLYNSNGSIINISPRLRENTLQTRYRLQVVATIHSGLSAGDLGFDMTEIENRLSDLETKMLRDKGTEPEVVGGLKAQVEEFREKLESVEHLSWLGLFKDISSGTSLQPFWNKSTSSSKKTTDDNKRVYDRFVNMSQVQVTDQVREYLKKATFDNWQWDDAEILVLLRQMFIDLNLPTIFNIEMVTLHNWLYEIYRHYNHVPFHNFKHCFMVTQMMYGLIWLIGLQHKLEAEDIFILLTSAICHDLDHPGYNNTYQVNARTELALLYNDISPLENHHCAVAFEILENPNCNIFKSVPKETFKRIREGNIKCILATDMAKHSEFLSAFKTVIPEFSYDNKDHKLLLLMILIKTADISNECRPMEVSEPWVECLLEEFFNQSDLEKLEGLPVAPFMDREKVTKPSSQVGFIKYVLLPLFEALGTLYPIIQDDIIKPVRDALHYYTDMEKLLEDERKTKESETNTKATKSSENRHRKKSAENKLSV